MKGIASILSLLTLVSTQHATPAKRAILGQGYGKVEVESIDKSIEVNPSVGTQNSLYISPPIKDLPISNLNHLQPPFEPKQSEQHYANSFGNGPTIQQQSNVMSQQYGTLIHSPLSANNILFAATSSTNNEKGYLPPTGNNHQTIQPGIQNYQNQLFPLKSTSETNQPTYKDYIAKTQVPEVNEQYYKASGYLPPINHPPSLKLHSVSDGSLPHNSQNYNANGKISFPQSSYEAPGYLPPVTNSQKQSTTHLLPVKDNFQISQQGYTEAYAARNLGHNQNYAAPDYLPPSNQPITSENSILQSEKNPIGDLNSKIHSFSTPLQQNSAPEYLPPQQNAQYHEKILENTSAQQLNHHQQTFSAPDYLPPNQSGSSDIDVRLTNGETAQSNEHNGYDYAKPQGSVFNEGPPSKSNIKNFNNENRSINQNVKENQNQHKSHTNYENSVRFSQSENLVQTIKIIRENLNGEEEAVRTIQIISDNNEPDGIKTIKILKNNPPVANFNIIKIIPQTNPNIHLTQQNTGDNKGYLPPEPSSIFLQHERSNNEYLPPQSNLHSSNSNKGFLQTNNQPISSFNSISTQIPELHLSNTQNSYLPPLNQPLSSLRSTSNQISALHLSNSNNGYLPPNNQPISSLNSITSQNSYLPPHNQPLSSLNNVISQNSYLTPNSQRISSLSSTSNQVSSSQSPNMHNKYLPPKSQPLPTVSTSNPNSHNNYLPPNNQPLPSLSSISADVGALLSSNIHNDYLPPNNQPTSQFDVIKILGNEDSAIYAGVASSLQNVRIIEILENESNPRPFGQGYPKTLRLYRKF